jgi:alkaline phosphatase D
MKYLIVLAFLLPTYLFAQWPARMEYDTEHAPFLHGIASGDPLSDKVILWTRITPPDNYTGNLSVYWEIAFDENFYEVVNSGEFVTNDFIDYTVKVDADNLYPDFTYYYRFYDENGFYSAVGRTRTTPIESGKQHLRFATCYGSSLYSGYFNAYHQIASRDDLHGIIHLGDYIYDFVDTDEHVRVPDNFPYFEGGAESVEELDEWRYIHNIYHMDIDFRNALSKHPIMVIWDNHDITRLDKEKSIKAFLEWTPTRLPDINDSLRLFRHFRYSDLVDIYMVDMWNYKNSEGNNLLGQYQTSWLKNTLLASDCRWHVLAEQKPMGGWDMVLGMSYNSNNTWDGYPDERNSLYHFLASFNINNNLVLSGDSHLTIAMDLKYSGQQIGVELMPASITRGNFNEMGYGFAAGIAEAQSMLVNSHHVFCNFTEQGYAVLDFTLSRAIGEVYYCDILEYSEEENLGKAFRTNYNSNKWDGVNNSVSPAIINQNPYNIQLDNLSVQENSPTGTIVGHLSASDNDEEDTHLFGLVDNANGRFEIDSNKLVVNNYALLDYESNQYHSVSVFTVDNRGAYFQRDFNISILDVNEPPINILLTDTIFEGNNPIGTTISSIEAEDPDFGENFTFQLISGPGDDNNSQFVVNGNNLVLGLYFNNADSVYNIRLKVTDSGGLTFEKAFLLYNELLTSQEDILADKTILLYPNPAKDKITLQIINDYSGSLTVSVINQSGVEVSTMQFNKKSTFFKKEIYTGSFRSGSYILKISGDNFENKIKFVVE